jgi:hypothetical protein
MSPPETGVDQAGRFVYISPIKNLVEVAAISDLLAGFPKQRDIALF